MVGKGFILQYAFLEMGMEFVVCFFARKCHGVFPLYEGSYNVLYKTNPPKDRSFSGAIVSYTKACAPAFRGPTFFVLFQLYLMGMKQSAGRWLGDSGKPRRVHLLSQTPMRHSYLRGNPDERGSRDTDNRKHNTH